MYFPPNIVPMIKLRRMRWAERVECMGASCIQGFGGET